MQESQVQRMRVTCRYGVRRPVAMAKAVFPELGQRRKSEEKIKRRKSPFCLGGLSTLRQRSDRTPSPESLVIQSSQPTLLRIAKVLRAREEALRSPSLLAKYNRHIHLPHILPDAKDHNTSFDSNGLDLTNWVEEGRRKVEMREIAAADLIKADSESPLRHSIKRQESPIVSHFRQEALPKPPSRLSGGASLRSSQPHRFPIEQNTYLRIRWLRKQSSGLKRLNL